MLKITNTNEAPAAIGPYSQAIAVDKLLFTSGQLPIVPASGKIEGTTIEEQTEASIKNIAAILKANNTSFEKVIKTTCFLSDIADFAKFNAIYAKYFTGNPARSCFAVKQLPMAALVEIEVIAYLG